MVTEFVCPYAKTALPADRPCEVESCSFNLADIPISRAYKRCFLNYVKATSHNPYQREALEKVEFCALPLHLREQISKSLLAMKNADETSTKRMFYTSLFSIMVHDSIVSLAKKQHAPVLYRQCCVCGTQSDSLWLPKGGCLPSGYGYCSWSCWQENPPPLLALAKSLEVDFCEMLDNISFPNGHKSKLMFTTHLTKWILGENAIK